MTTKEYQIGTNKRKITWAASEYFGELSNKTYTLGQMEATQIAPLANLSLTAKLLLSTVAGDIIQHLLDQGFSATDIFKTGTFFIKQNT